MASIGRGHLRCKVQGCNRVRPYWTDKCKRHREPETARDAYESDLECKDEYALLERAKREGVEVERERW